jgi:scyllo-inositol 2-dehydrogenase (NADP+)
MASQIKVGIAGLGRSGWGIHARAIADLPDLFTVVAVCDPDPTRQAEAQERFGCRAYDACAPLRADDQVELVVVATPSHLHLDDTVLTLRAGKHVLVEKPMGRSLAEVDAMMATAQATGQILTVNQNYRYAADFLKIKEIIASGVLGRVLQIRIAVHQFTRRWDWQTLQEFGGGILNNHGAHVVDFATLLMDDPEPRVFCHMEATPLYAGDADSHVKIILQPQSGPLFDIELTHACAYPQERWLVMGTQGSLVSDRTTVRWKYFEPDEVSPLVLDTHPTPDRSYNREALPWHEETVQLDNDFGAEMQQLYRDLYAAVRGSAPLAITAESVRRQVAILEKCRALSPI